MNMDPNLIEAKITPRTKALLPVHVFGLPADMPAITSLAKLYHLKMIEDTCEALGTEIWEKKPAPSPTGQSLPFTPISRLPPEKGA